jgi:hypothetical protein
MYVVQEIVRKGGEKYYPSSKVYDIHSSSFESGIDLDDLNHTLLLRSADLVYNSIIIGKNIKISIRSSFNIGDSTKSRSKYNRI